MCPSATFQLTIQKFKFPPPKFNKTKAEVIIILTFSENNKIEIEPATISLKGLLAASVEMAKLGGHEVREVREQVRSFFEFKLLSQNVINGQCYKAFLT